MQALTVVPDGATFSNVIERTGRFARIDSSMHADTSLIVFGDIHGDLDALEEGLAYAGPDDYLVFLGDYADRGSFGIEVIERIDGLLHDSPDRIVALKGNHEWYSADGQPSFYPCSLIAEANEKRGSWAEYFETFFAFTQKLSVAAVFGDRLFFVHGGIHPEIVTVDDLAEPSDDVFTQLMWGDPGTQDGMHASMRGIGYEFGVDVTDGVTDRIGVSHIIRSHQPARATNGPAYDHDGRVITLSSTSVYGGLPHILIVDSESNSEEAPGFRVIKLQS